MGFELSSSPGAIRANHPIYRGPDIRVDPHLSSFTASKHSVMKISEIIASLQSVTNELGDVEVVIFSGKWEDCRSSDKQWPIVAEVIPVKHQNKAAICTKYGEG